MSTCKEHDLSKIAKIEAYQGHFITTPVYLQTLTANKTVLTGKTPLTKIPFTKDSAKLDDKQDISVAGRVNTITLSWKWQPNTQADYDWLLDLQNNPHELLITYFGGTQRIVRTSPDAYKFEFSDDDGDCKCKMTLVNGQGFTRILEE